VVYDMKSMWPLAKKAGVQDAEGFSSRFLPTLMLPFALIYVSYLAALVCFLVFLRLPHIYLWYLSKERRKKICQELPIFVSSLQWALTVYPVPDAIASVDFGETSKVFANFCKRYKRGDDFEEALMGSMVFPELEEIAKRLIVIYKTGTGVDLLDLYVEKISSENLAKAQQSAARMQIFALAYTALAAVLPAMYSGLSIYSGANNVIYLALLASVALVFSWKIID